MRATAAWWACLGIAAAACSGPSHPPSTIPVPPTAPSSELALRVARAEAKRGGGLDELIELATHGLAGDRALALRGLGRVGGPRALATLRTALTDSSPDVVGAAASAIGVAASLDDRAVGIVPTAELVAALARAETGHADDVLEALGRAGDASALPALTARIGANAAGRTTALLALGRFGRRKLPIDEAARYALLAALDDSDPAVRYAATYALAREQRGADDSDKPAVIAKLAARIGDADPDVRAMAAFALAARRDVPGARADLLKALADVNWRVAVEGVHALAGEHGDPQGQRAVATILVTRLASLASDPAANTHVIFEALRTLGTATDVDAVVAVSDARTKLGSVPGVPPTTMAWLDCLALEALVRTSASYTVDQLAKCGGPSFPDSLRAPLIAEAAQSKIVTTVHKWAAVKRLLANPDDRIAAQAYGILQQIAETSAVESAKADELFVTALESGSIPVLDAALGSLPKESHWYDPHVLNRLAKEPDVSEQGSLLAVVGERKIDGGAAVCRKYLAKEPALARAAAACLVAYGEAAPPYADPPAVAAPPVDLTTVVGKQLVWHVTTTRGDLHIRLHPEVAPWACASVVQLTTEGFYNGLVFHRIVPDFVAQGGDPTGTGAGGAKYNVPAEPGAFHDYGQAGGFMAGGAGLADSGPDTGSSQWFVMHSRAAHLDGRYTWFGSLAVEDQPIADALQLGDTVVSATIEPASPKR